MSKRILCKFFAHGACLKGDNCEFSHDWKDPTNNICTYYQRGICSYGSRCRYEHVKASRPQPSASSSSGVPRSSPTSASNPLACAFVPDLSPVPSSCLKPAWSVDSLHQNSLDEVDTFIPGTAKPEEQPICSYAAAGDCPRGDECPHIHGNICPTCGKRCLHPFRPEEREEHKKVCKKKQNQLEALKLSQEIECCVCLERVLSKPTPAERKFGLLTECDHAFCIACIRNWRSSSPSTGMDVNSTLRACPICRKLSYFVVPSVIWFSAPEEKKEILDNYREKLRSIDCKHFNFGDGNCPFGTSCFYKHTVKPGSYAWKYHMPPPRRPRPRPSGSNFSDVDTLVNMIGNIMSEGEYGPIGLEDSDDDELTTTDMMMMLMHMGVESEDSSNEDSY
uniref:Zinc finger CCCH domain-containing protein 69 n=1 Tax=Noccaea caerulescens TaxID=107243 RepID=A0A1J3J5L1_NOCCA